EGRGHAQRVLGVAERLRVLQDEGLELVAIEAGRRRRRGDDGGVQLGDDEREDAEVRDDEEAAADDREERGRARAALAADGGARRDEEGGGDAGEGEGALVDEERQAQAAARAHGVEEELA